MEEIAKFVLMPGLVPVAGGVIVSGALPPFVIVTVRGLSALVCPTCVAAKFNVGALPYASFTAVLNVSSATNRLPPASINTPAGSPSPVPSD